MDILQEFLRQRALLQRMQELNESMIDSDVMNGYTTSSLKLIFDADNSIRCVPNYKTKSGRAG